METIRKTITTLLLSAIFCLPALAQETNCDDGIDNDGNGFVDCFDSNCSGGSSCTDFFFGNSVECQDEPTEDPTFSIRVQWGSADRTANSHATPTVGDIDQDGTPEIVVSNKHAQTVAVLDGVTGSTEFTIPLSFQPENGIAIGNIDSSDDECAWIFVGEDRGNGDLAAFDCTGAEMWTATVGDKVGMLGLADFNGDGQAELYYGDEIRNALTGAVIVAESGNLEVDFTHGSIAVDALDASVCATCDGLELITGNEIWAIDISTGSKTLVKDMNDVLAAQGETGTYHPKYYPNWGGENWTNVSVADFNLDGNVDVLMPGALGSDYNGTTTIFFWDVANESVRMYSDLTNNHSRGTGRINIADVDGDGALNANFVSDQKLYSLDTMMNPIWIKGIKEGSSGFTGCTLFDFDGDDAAETIYRSESQLLIIDGTDGSTRTTAPCISRTQEEYPIVADVDGDGASEICVTCYTSDAMSFSPYSNSEFGHVRIFESDGEVWQPSRTVWNQHGYYNVNVDDDLTIPAQQQDHTAVFGQDCDTGIGDNRPLNTFLTQSTILESNGCPSFVSPDINLIAIDDATASLCPETEFDVTFTLRNDGDTDLSGTLPLAFYKGDPRTADAELIFVDSYPLDNFLVDSSLTITRTVEGSGGDFDLYLLINDAGSQPPVTIGTASIPECETGNNLASRAVTSAPFELTALKVSDNEKCDDSASDNGEAIAYYQGTIGGGTETLYFENFEDLADGTTEDTGATGWTRTKANKTDLAAVSSRLGTKAFEANDTDGIVEWTSDELDISSYEDVSISVDLTASTRMENADYMEVYFNVDGVTDPNPDTFNGSFGFQSVSQTGVNGSTLQIVVIARNSANNERYYLDNVIVTGTLGEQTGQFTEANGFTFSWYDENMLTVLYEGSSITGMPEGTYQVQGYFAEGDCYSDVQTVVIDLVEPAPFTVIGTEVAPLTDCVTPDGEASVVIEEADLTITTTGYTFTWFNSDDLSTPLVTGTSLTGANAGTYIILAEHIATGCTEQGSVEITSTQTPTGTPQLVSKDDVSSCVDPTNGSITVDVDGQVGGLQFDWYEGTVAVGDPIHSATGNLGATLDNIGVGDYTVTATGTSGCISAPLTITVGSTVVFPDPTVTTTDNTSCNIANGSASADGDGAGTVAGYDFDWFAGNNTLAENQLPTAIAGTVLSNNDSEVTGMPGGTYTLVVTDQASGCATTTTLEITDAYTDPLFEDTYSLVDTDQALEVEGQAHVETAQIIAGMQAVTISYWVNLSADNYTNDARIFSSGGTGENQVLLWSDNHDGLAFVMKTENDGGRGRINTAFKPTGWTQVVGTWDGTTGDMAIYANGVLLGTTNYVGTGLGIIDTGNPMFLARDGNLGAKKFEGQVDEFRIYNKALSQAEILAQMCTALTGSEDGLVLYYDFDELTLSSTTIQDKSTDPVSTTGSLMRTSAPLGSFALPAAEIECANVDVDPNSTCDAANPNGQIDISGFIMPATDTYTFSLYDGFDTSGSLLASNTTGVFTDLAGGFYTIIATSLTSECVTPPVTITVPDLQDRPSIVGTPSDNTNCVAPFSGQISITASSSFSEPTSYTYNVYDGPNTTSLLQTFTVADGSVATVATGLDDGTYRVEVINDDILCSNFIDVVVGETTTDPTFVASANDNVSCGAATGSVSITSVSGTNILSVTDHSYTWYSGQVVDAGSLLGETSSSLSGVGQGYYTVVVSNDNTGCESDPQTFYVDDVPYDPIITVGQIEDTSCATFPADGTGQLGAYATQTDQPGSIFGDEDGYTFEWYEGNGTGGTLISSSDTTAATIAAGTYTLVVTGGASCSATTVVVLNNNPITPVVTGGTVNDNDICDASFLNGSNGGDITVDVTFDGAAVTDFTGYTFTWYEGNGTGGTQIVGDATPSPNGSEPVITDNNISGLLADQYTVVVTSPNSCESASAVFEVNDAVTLPSISTTVDANLSSCDALAPNGAASANVGGNTADYDFEWFVGNGTTTSISAPAAAGGTNNSEATGLAAGTYTVRATDQATGCQSTQTVSIGTALATVSITSSATTDDDQCTGGNGAITISEVQVVDNGVTSTYSTDADINANVTLELYASDGTTLLGSFTAPDTTGLPDGSYVVIVTDNTSTCTSANVPFVIDDIQVNPALTATEAAPSTVCVGGTNPDGSANVVVDNAGGSVNYTYLWHTGNDTSSPINTTTNPSAATATLSGVEPGFYTVLVTDTDGTGNGCSNTATVEITLDATTIAIGGSTTTDASNCDGLDNGEFSITQVTEDGAPVGGATYNYEFFDDGGGSLQSGATASISSLTPGDYSVVITNTSTNCESASIPFTIDDVSVTPDLSLSITDNSDCGTAGDNGSITVNIASASGTYSYEWFNGSDVNDEGSPFAGTGAGTATISGLAAGDYWVKVTDTADPSSGCEAKIAGTVADDPTEMTITAATPVDSDQCTPENGSITVTTVDINTVATDAETMTGYTFQIYDNAATPAYVKDFENQADGISDPSATDLASGTYHVVIVENASGCTSNLYQFAIGNNAVSPTLTVAEDQASTVCAGGSNPDGEASVTITNDDTDAYTYLWHTGNDTSSPINTTTNPSAATATLTGVEAGFYTVLVTDTETGGLGCFNTATVEITLDPTTIAIGASTTTDASNCDGLDNGEFSITQVTEDGAPVGGATYNYEFFDNGGGSLQSGATASISSLTPGDYSVVITNTSTNCESASIPFTIDDVSVTPDLSLSITDNSDCGTAGDNGSITANIASASGTYTYEWFNGSDVNDEGSPFAGTGAGTATISGLAAGDYWVKVTDTADPSSGCEAKIAGTVADDPTEMTITAATPVDSDQCTPENGSITVTTVDINTVATDAETMTGYTFQIYDNAATPAYVKDFENQADGVSDPSATDLASGTYHVVIVENASGCTSNLYQFAIGNNAVSPTLTVAEDQPSTVCAGGSNPDGEASVTITNDDTDAYTYLWHTGNDTSSPINTTTNPSAATATLTGVEAGFYTVLVTDTETGGLGCFNTATVEITLDPTTIAIGASTTTDASNCDGLDNGEFSITQVTEDGAPVGGATYNYEFFDNGGGSLQNGTTASISSLTPGNYSVVITNTSTNCESASIPFTIDDVSVVPDLSLSIMDNTDCGTAGDNGSITVNIAGASGTYTYEWFNGSDINDEGSPFAGTGAGTATISGLGAGDYWVKVTDTADPSSACEGKITGEVIDDPAEIAVTAATIVGSDQCVPENGSITVTTVDINTVSTNAETMTGYTFKVYDNAATPAFVKNFENQADGTNDPSATDLSPGTYHVVVEENVSGCESNLYQFVIDDNAPVPTTNTISGNDNTACAGTPNGSVSISFVWTGGAVDYQWYYGTIASGTAVALATGADPGNGSFPSDPTATTVTGLAGGTYYVEITDNDGGAGTGCVFQQEVTILNDASIVVIASGAKDQDNTGCIAANHDGSYTVTSVTTDGAGAGFPGDYNFEWYTSTGTLIETTDGGSGGATKADFGAGSYYVIAVDKATSCSSASEAFTIADNLTIPAITASTITNVERCDDTIDNGVIDIDVDGIADPGAAYSIQWYSGGVSTIGAGTLLAGQTDDVISTLDIGTYSVRVTIAATGCSLDQAFVVGSDVPKKPSFTIAVTTEPDVCNPGNGVLTASGFAGAATDYTWTWLLDDRTTDISTTGAVVANEVVTSVSEGDYYAVIEDISTGCVSDTVPVTIDRDASAVFTIVETITQAPGDCDGAVGSFTIDISDGSGTTTVDVSITDDFGNTITANGVTINGGAPEITVADIDPGDGSTFIRNVAATNGVLDFINGGYYVEVTNSNITTCDGDLEFFLPFDEAPRLDLATPVVTSHSYNCNPYGGSAISAGDNTDGVTGGQGGATGEVSVTLTLIDGADPAIDDNHDNYQIFLYQGTDPLPSPNTDIEVTLDNASALSVMDFVTVGGGASTAQVTAISGNDVTLEFEDGDITDFTTSGNFLDGGEQITAVLKDGLWSVSTGRATDIQVAEGILVAVATDEGVGSSGFNGGVNDYQRTYTFSGLTAGEYTILAAQEGKAFCLSPSVTFEVEDRFDEFYIDAASAVYVDIDDNDDCSGVDANATGAIDLLRIDRILQDVSGADSTATGTNVSDFTFAWYQGTVVDTNAEIPADVLTTAVLSNGNATLTGVPAGSYTVQITGDHGDGVSGNLCVNTYTFVVDDNPDDISIDLGGTTPTASANTNCDAPFDGSIDMNNVDIEITDRDGNTTTQQWPITDWEAYLYESGTGLLAFNGTDNTQASDINYLDDGTTTGTDFTQLEDGDYIIVLFDDSGCEATAYSITVGDGKTNPALTDGTADTNNTNCISNPNGQITVELAGDPADYDIQWFIGGIASTTAFVDGTDGTVATAGVSPATLSITNIIGGTYTVRVEDLTNSVGCVSFYTTSISDDVDAIIDFEIATTDDTNCSPDNGTVRLTDIDLFNTSTNTATGLTAGDETAMDVYTITVYQTDGTTVVDTDAEDAGDNLTISGLSSGDYLIAISHPTNSCESAQKAFTIDDTAVTPTIVITQDQANTVCDPAFGGGITPTGQLTATIQSGAGVDMDGDYTFEWFIGSTGDTSEPVTGGAEPNGSDATITNDLVSDPHTSELSGLVADTYWVRVTDTSDPNNTCISTTEFTLTNDFADIDVDVDTDVVITDASDCSGANLTGQIVINDVDVDGASVIGADGDLANYEFELFNSANASQGVQNPAAAVTSVTYSNLAPDTYRLIVRSEVTGCVSALQQIVVGQDDDVPVIAAPVITADTYCTGGNGTVTLDVTAPDADEADYDFDWYEGAGTTTPLAALSGVGNNSAANLDAGTYTIVVTAENTADAGIGCSSQVIVVVDDDPDVVDVLTADITPTHVDNCSTGNGEIDVADVQLNGGSDGTGGYTLHLYQSDNATEIGGAFTGTNAANLDAGTYYVRARSTSGSLCESAGTLVVIEDNAVTPTITIVQDAANTVCDPAFGGGITPTGQLTATIQSGAGVDMDGDYTFEWFIGSTGDTSEPVTGGAEPNGSDATITNDLVSDPHTSELSGLVEDTYWVRVTDFTDPNNTCVATAEFTLTNDLEDIDVDVDTDVVVTDASDCSGANLTGQIVINDVDVDGASVIGADGDLANYEFELFNSANASQGVQNPAAAVTSVTYSNLAPDTYRLIVRSEVTGCVSALQQIVVGQDDDVPVIAAPVITADTYCTGGNGTVTLDVTAPDADEADYDFDWYEGAGTTTPLAALSGVGNNSAANLDAGTYTIVVTAENTADAGIGCSSQVIVVVDDDPDVVDVLTADITPTHVDNCSTGNGEIDVADVQLNGGSDGTGGYTLHLYQSDNATEIGGAFTGTNAANLDAGTYYVRARSTSGSLCESAGTLVVIEDNAVTPTITIVQDAANTVCDPAFGGGITPTGQLTATIQSGAGVDMDGDYTFEWFIGSTGDTSEPVTGGAEPNGSDATITNDLVSDPHTSELSGLVEDTYWVRVTDFTDPNNTCVATAEFTLTNDLEDIDVDVDTDVVVTDASDCSGANLTGQIVINDVDVDGASVIGADGDLANYEFELFNSANASQGVQNPAAAVTSVTYSNLAPDTYRLIVRSEVTGCVSALQQIVVGQDDDVPVIAAPVITADTYCTGGNGTVTLDVTAPDADEADYDFDWYEGAGTTTPLAALSGVGNNSAANLDAGTYTIVVTAENTADAGIGCSSQVIVVVDDDPDVVDVLTADITPTHVTDCAAGNGEIDVADVQLNGGSDGTGGYTLHLYQSDNATEIGGAFTGTNAANLDAGTYFVRARSTSGSLCESAGTQVVIMDNSADPVVVITEVQANTYCSGAAAADGQLQAQVDEGGPLVTAGYSFQWYKGSLGDMSDPRDATAMTAADLEDGNYWVRVTDTDGADDNLGCSTDATFILSHDPTETTVVTASATNDTRCDSDNGTITVSEVSFTRLGATTTASTAVAIDTDFTLAYYDESLNFINNFTAAAGVTGLSAGTYYITATHDTYECVSATFEVEVLEDVAFPDLVGTPTIVNNTSCDIAAANGSITFEVETAGAHSGAYTFTWSGALVGSGAGTNADPHTVTGLDNGTYTVLVEDNANGCSSEFEFQVLDEQIFPSISLDDNSVTDVTTCLAANGSITIDVSDISGSSADINDYTLSVTGAISGAIPNPAPVGSTMTYSNLGVDVYTISVTDNTNTCQSGTIEVSIVDASVDPVLSVASMTPNDECTVDRETGAITIAIDGDPTGANHTIQWYDDATTTTPAGTTYGVTDDQSLTLDNVPDGQYAVTVSNNTDGCSTTQIFTITNDPVSPIITSFEANNNLDCVSPSGSGSLVAATLDGTVLDSATLAAEYTIGWYSNAALTATVTDPDPLVSPLELNGLAAGTYYAVITRDLTGCSSTAYQFTIVDNPSLPEIEIEVVQADSTCSATVGTGILVAKADGQTDANTNYTFNWYDDSSNLLATNDTLSDLLAGTYTIEVTHVNTGCVDTESITLGNAPQEPEILTVSVTDPTNCEPGNGVIEVTGVSIATTDRYTFAFFDDNPLSGATAFQDGSSTSFSAGLPDMTYYIVGTDTLTGCTTGVYQVQLSADDIVYPEIQLVSALSNRQCDPALADGEMTLAIYTTIDDVRSQVDPADYTITWSDSNGNAISTTVDAAQMTISAEDLEAGSYTIVATNNATGCTTVDIVRLADDRPPFVLLPSSAPNLNCDNPNGSVNVRVQQVGTFVRDAEFFWFIGDVENPDISNPDYTGVDPDGLEQGIYTVIARGTEDPSCISERATVEVEDGTVPPDYTIVVDNHVTICYEDQPNGLARIDTAASDVSAYEFMWYEGADTTGAQIQTGLSADSLSIGTYTVLARDRNTGCVALQNVEIIDDTPAIADPTIVVVSGRTNCLFPNGVAVANTGGLTNGFRFEWYAADNPDSLLFVGNEIQTLDADTYEVLAIDIASGCVSGRSTTTIPYAVEDPEFSIVTTGSLCLRTEDGSANQFSGQAFVAIETLGVYVDSVTYFDNAGDIVLAARGAETLIDATPGAYTVNFRASNGCDYSSTFVIESEIRIYNGVSANDDGMNDFFLIDCLDFFENNNVQIFTRDGIRIYEIDGYDNVTNRFNGTSNVGATQDLPAGTYFYVIDKGDGSDLIQGFLELVR